MKNRILLLILCLTILACGLLSSCDLLGTGNTGTDISEPTKLTAPNVILKNDKVTWSTDPHAVKFEISIDGNLSYIENTVASRKLTNGQTFKIRAIGDGTNYTNSDWSNSVTYVKPIPKYTITWKNGDTVIETDTEVSEGTIPTYNGTTPAKAADSQYSYIFSGWSPQVVAANEDVTYTAIFTSVLNKYTVTWKNDDTILEIDENIEYGTMPTYDGTEPTKAADAQYSYVFVGWSPEVVAATENTTYIAVFNSVSHKYTVTWKNGDSVLETDENVEHGTMPTYDGVEPTKAADAQYSYVFAGWNPEVVTTNGDVTYTAVFTSVLNKYTVTWKNGDNTLETDENVEYGTMPTYNGAEPQKAADAQYVYVFSGWSPVVSEVVDNVTYVAQFTSALNSYTIVWKNGDSTLETDENATYGSTPSYDGATPTKDATAQYTYTFSGWAPQISSVTGSVTYQAQFTETLRSYTVTFYTEDGLTILDTVTVEYGSTVAYSKSTPVKNATEGHTYVFDKWVTTQGGNVADDLTNVIGDRSVYASFKDFVRTVTVYIVSNNNDYGTVSVSALNNIPYGATITVNGNTITVNGQSVTANANTATAQYTYTFANWTADATVGNDTIITANFSRSVNSYTVTWKNGDTVLETDENVVYGTTPVYNSAQPTKESDNENIYTFSGWSPAISSVTGDITYVAQFTTTANKHTVVFYDDDGVTELGRVVVGHGENAIYPNALPTKESTVEIAYTFEKWVTAKDGATEASFANITEDKSVYAKYSTTARTYVVTFCDYDGTILSQLDVAYGNAATAPGDPEREGYRFDGWDKTFSNITGELTVKATYVQQFTVEFLDYDNSVIDIQLIDYNGNATAPQNPTRNNYRFTGWNTGFANVVSDLTVKAEYIRQYKVTFLDYDETVLKEVIVDTGSTTTAPFATTEERNSFVGIELEGYIFKGWDKTFSYITEDLIVKATYVQQFTVEFLDYDNSIIDIQIVDYNENAIAPKDPTRTNYRFIGWNTDFTNVVHNLTVKAQYIRQYKVTFVDYDGTLLKEATIDAGATAVAPNDPTKEGYTFDGWDKSFTNVSSDLTVTATYKVKTYTVKFVMPDGTTIGEEQSVEHGFSAIAPECSEIFLVGTGIDTKIYSFTSWDKSFDKVTEDLVIKAVYDTVYTKPVIVVDFGSAPHTSTTVYIYSHSSITLNAVELEFKYNTNAGEIEMNSVTFAGVFKENPQYVINNNEKKFSFAWSNAEGTSYDNCARLLTFDLDIIVGGTTIGEDTFLVEVCNIIVSDSHGENLEKITPVFVYR